MNRFYYCLSCPFWCRELTDANKHLKISGHAISRIDLDVSFKLFSDAMKAKFLEAMNKGGARSPVPWITYTRKSMEDGLQDEWREYCEGIAGHRKLLSGALPMETGVLF